MKLVAWSAAAGLQYYAPTLDANRGPKGLCCIDTTSAPDCIWGCVDSMLLQAKIYMACV